MQTVRVDLEQMRMRWVKVEKALNERVSEIYDVALTRAIGTRPTLHIAKALALSYCAALSRTHTQIHARRSPTLLLPSLAHTRDPKVSSHTLVFYFCSTRSQRSPIAAALSLSLSLDLRSSLRCCRAAIAAVSLTSCVAGVVRVGRKNTQCSGVLMILTNGKNVIIR